MVVSTLSMNIQLKSLNSLFINVNHAERCSLIGFAFVLNSKDHDFITREAVRLLLGNFENKRDQLLHVLLYITNIQCQVSHQMNELRATLATHS